MSYASNVTAQRLQRSQQRHAGVAAVRARAAATNLTVAAPDAPTLDNFVTRVVEQCGSAVVKIQTEREREAPDTDLEELLESLFGGGGEVFIGADGILFGGDGGRSTSERRRRERRRKRRNVLRGQGSGFLIDEHHVLTNAHVVKGASAVKVLLKNGEQLIGDVKGMKRRDAWRSNHAYVQLGTSLGSSSGSVSASPPLPMSMPSSPSEGLPLAFSL